MLLGRGVPIPAPSSILQSIQALQQGVPGAWDQASPSHGRWIPRRCRGDGPGEKSLVSRSYGAARPQLRCPVSWQRLHLISPGMPPPCHTPAPCPGQGTQGRARSPSHTQRGGDGAGIPTSPAPPEPPASAGLVFRTNPGAGSAEPLSSLPRSRSAAVQSVCKAVQSVYPAGTGPGD